MDNQLYERSEKTFQIMEFGNLDLNNLVEKAFILFGNTKAGKTTSMHYFKRSQLEGVKQKQYSSVIYKFKSGPDDVKDASIGYHESQSQTQIPNICKISLDSQGKQNVSIIDSPGYSDSYGCLRSVSNNFFIHKMFSLVKRIKFIIVVPLKDLERQATGLLETFISFFKMFKNAPDLLQSIQQSISLLITSVDEQFDRQLLYKKFENSSQKMITDYAETYKKLKTQLIDNKRIYPIKKAILGKIADNENTLLQQINRNCKKWWHRQLTALGKVDTESIKINIKDNQKDQIKFQVEVTNFSQFLQKSFKFYFLGENGFQKICQQFIEGVKNQQPFKISQKIQNVLKDIEKKNQFGDEQYKRLNKKYNDKKKKVLKQLFEDDLNASQKQYGISQKQIPTKLEKMIALKKLLFLAQPIIINQKQRQIQTIKMVRNNLKQVLKIFIRLSKRTSSYEKMLNYAFIIYNKFQITNEIYQIFLNTIQDISRHKKQNSEPQKQFQYICLTYPSSLKRVFNFFKESGHELLINYIKSLDTSRSYDNPKIYKLYQKFIQDVKKELQSMPKQNLSDIGINENKFQNVMRQFQKIQYGLQIKYTQANIYKDNFQLRDKGLIQLENKRKLLAKKIKSQETQLDGNFQKDLSHNSKLCQLIGIQFIQKNPQIAIKIFQSVKDAHQVLQIYKKLQKNTLLDIRNQQSKRKMMNLLIDYMKKAYKYCRKQLAIKKAQKAFSIAQLLGDRQKMQQIGKFLHKICPVSYQQSSQQEQDHHNLMNEQRNYLQMMNLGIFKVEFSEQLSRQISNIQVPEKINKSNSKSSQSPSKNS